MINIHILNNEYISFRYLNTQLPIRGQIMMLKSPLPNIDKHSKYGHILCMKRLNMIY